MRDYIATIFGETFEVAAPSWQKARYLGCVMYLKAHPTSKFTITQLIYLGKKKVHVILVEDKRERFW